MRILTAVLVLLVASSHVVANGTGEEESSSTVAPTEAATSPAAPAATTPGGGASSEGTLATETAGTGSTPVSGSTVTDGSNTGSTVEAASTTPVPTTTPPPMMLSTFPISNGVTPLDAKLILQHAVQLDQQIKALTTYLVNAQADTNPDNSPLFVQLTNFTTILNAQNTTLQGYLSKLSTLNATQTTLDQRVTSASNTFVCFSQSSCVTDVPTTAEPTSPGPIPTETPCTYPNLTATSTTKSETFHRTQNVPSCVITVKASDTGYNVSININVTLSGPNSYVTLVDKRALQNVTFTSPIVTSNYNFTGFREVDVYYYACPLSSVQFSFDYVQVNSCTLNCTGDHGDCKISQSGVQYCECKPCMYSGDHCETPIVPCQAKQKRLCGENTHSGKCYTNPCFDQCYACACAENARISGNEQKCDAPKNPDPVPTPAGPPVCTSTAGPTTTMALLTSTMIPSASSPASSAPTDAPSAGSSSTTSEPAASSPVPAASSTAEVTTEAAGTTATDIPSTTP